MSARVRTGNSSGRPATTAHRNNKCSGDACTVLCNRRLHEYARELRDKNEHGFLYDLAERVHKHSVNNVGVRKELVVAPSLQMSDNELYDSITHNCLATMSAAVAGNGAASKGTYSGYDYNNDVDSSNSEGNGDYSFDSDRAMSVPVTDASFMARQLIKAERYRGEPMSSETRLCREKGICWNMEADGRQVRVTRSRVGGTSTCWKYPCPNNASFQRLVDTVQKERAKIMDQGRF